MVQKTMLMRYLIFGINSILILFTFSCKKDLDYTIRAKWIYINETNHLISYEPADIWKDFNLSAKDSIFYTENSEGPESVEVADFVPPINAQTVVYDQLVCDTALAQKLHDINEYESRKIAGRNYEFTFRFTDSNINLTDTCK